MLVERGADLTVRDRNHATPLDCAEDPAIFTILQGLGAPSGGYSPALESAVLKHNMDAIRFFLENGADVNARNADGDTVLLSGAGYFGRPDIFSYLLSVGADLQMKNREGNTVLHCACADCSPEMIEFLLQLPEVDLNAQNRWGKSPLHLLLEADVEKEDKKEQQRLACALVQHGASLKITDGDGNTPLDCAPTKALQKELQKAEQSRGK